MNLTKTIFIVVEATDIIIYKGEHKYECGRGKEKVLSIQG